MSSQTATLVRPTYLAMLAVMASMHLSPSAHSDRPKPQDDEKLTFLKSQRNPGAYFALVMEYPSQIESTVPEIAKLVRARRESAADEWKARIDFAASLLEAGMLAPRKTIPTRLTSKRWASVLAEKEKEVPPCLNEKLKPYGLQLQVGQAPDRGAHFLAIDYQSAKGSPYEVKDNQVLGIQPLVKEKEKPKHFGTDITCILELKKDSQVIASCKVLARSDSLLTLAQGSDATAQLALNAHAAFVAQVRVLLHPLAIPRGLVDETMTLAARPDDASRWVARGKAHIVASYSKDGLEDYRRASELDGGMLPRIVDQSAKEARRLIELNDSNSLGNRAIAMRHLDASLTLQPDHLDSNFLRGWLHLENRQYKSAQEDLTRALNFRPKDGLILFYRGRARKEQKDYKGALEDFNAAYVQLPNDVAVLENRGWTFHLLDRYDEAIADWEKAGNLDRSRKKVVEDWIQLAQKWKAKKKSP